MDYQGAQSQKEGQEEGTKDLGRGTPQLFHLSLVLLAFLLALGSLATHQAIPIHQAILSLKPAAQGFLNAF